MVVRESKDRSRRDARLPFWASSQDMRIVGREVRRDEAGIIHPLFWPCTPTLRQPGEDFLVDFEVTLTEEDEPYEAHPFEPIRFVSHRP